MRENFFFGGGASTSSMTPEGARAITLVAAMLLLVLPRKQAPAPILIVAFLIPFGQQIMVGGAHFFAIRIVIMAGLCRLLAAKISSSKTLFPAGFNGIDKAFSLLLVVGGTAFIIRQGAAAAIVYQTGFWLDAFGMTSFSAIYYKIEKIFSGLSRCLLLLPPCSVRACLMNT